MSEEWKDIKGYEGLYQISNLGKIKSLKKKGNWKEKILKPQLDCYGYLVVGLNKNRQVHRKSIHRLLAENFIKNEDNLPTVDHINRNRLDNRLENLRWADYKMQNSNKKTINLSDNLKEYTKKGKENPKSKSVLQYSLDERLLCEYSGLREAERITGIKSQGISGCCKGKAKTAGGYKWKYKEMIV